MNLKLPILILLLFSSFVGLSQKTIKGQVKDDKSQEGVPGVSVLVRGTNVGTSTDSNGNFSINVPTNATQLNFSSVGYNAKVISIGTQSFLTVLLEEDAVNLQEVVVNALGFKTKRDRTGSTSSSISSEAIRSSGEANILNSLAGKASGVKIARANGDPGAGTNIQIRGANTIGGSSQPLVIVDGVPLSNDNLYGSGSTRSGGVSQQSRLNDLNPEDIESTQILKGASAAALWGSRAANGVLVITTKQGKLNQKMKVSYSATYSMDEINRRHPLQTTFGQGTAGKYNPTATNSWGDKIASRSGGPDVFNTTGEYFLGNDGQKYYPITTKNSRDIFADKNFDQVFQKGSFLEHNLSITGGS